MKSASRDHRRHPLGSDRCESAFDFREGFCGVTTVDDRCRLFFDFFRHFSTISNFSNFPKKCLGPGASEKPFGPSRGVRQGILGVLRGSRRVRGASWEALGRSWSGLGGHLVARRFLIDFWIDFGVVLGAQKGAKMEPKRDQKRIKIEGQNDVEKRSFLRPSWSRLGAILGHFGSNLGV